MHIIPVIDVRHGIAVHATGGRRDGYRPLQTPLASDSDPVAVAQGIFSLFAFPVLYVADLDAIEGRRPNAGMIGRLSAALPGVRLWVDAGANERAVARAVAAAGPATPVLGTESIAGEEGVSLASLPGDRYVLSLDFKDDRFVGPPRLLTDAADWPERVIVMTLGRVGGGGGPDLVRLAEIAAKAPQKCIYAAGGVRNSDDVAALAAAGAAGALIATALHAQTITAGDLHKIAGR